MSLESSLAVSWIRREIHKFLKQHQKIAKARAQNKLLILQSMIHKTSLAGRCSGRALEMKSPTKRSQPVAQHLPKRANPTRLCLRKLILKRLIQISLSALIQTVKEATGEGISLLQAKTTRKISSSNLKLWKRTSHLASSLDWVKHRGTQIRQLNSNLLLLLSLRTTRISSGGSLNRSRCWENPI